MKGILFAKVTRLLRNPAEFLLLIILSIIFALILGGNDIEEMNVPTFIESNEKEVINMVEQIEQETVFTPELEENQDDLLEKVRSGKSEFGLIIDEEGFEIIVGIDSHNVYFLEQSLRNIYEKNLQYEALASAINVSDIAQEVENNQIFQTETISFQGEDTFVYQHHLQTIFGFSLFFSIFIIMSSVLQILLEKNGGLWDRMIISPVRKWEMYVANFFYSFIIGYVQIVIVLLVFRYIVKVDFPGSFLLTFIVTIPYVLAIVALSILIVSLVKTVQQFNATVPIVAVGMAMIGGAYWPLEIVDSSFMITLSKFVPVTYGMELLQGVTIYNYTLEEMLYPVSILLLMTVFMTGIGIHLMEKRYIS